MTIQKIKPGDKISAKYLNRLAEIAESDSAVPYKPHRIVPCTNLLKIVNKGRSHNAIIRAGTAINRLYINHNYDLDEFFSRIMDNNISFLIDEEEKSVATGLFGITPGVVLDNIPTGGIGRAYVPNTFFARVLVPEFNYQSGSIMPIPFCGNLMDLTNDYIYGPYLILSRSNRSKDPVEINYNYPRKNIDKYFEVGALLQKIEYGGHITGTFINFTWTGESSEKPIPTVCANGIHIYGVEAPYKSETEWIRDDTLVSISMNILTGKWEIIQAMCSNDIPDEEETEDQGGTESV